MKLDKSSPIPITHQLEQLLREQIATGELSIGQRLPTEMELCARLGVSRTPIRNALGKLVDKGLLVRYPGRGTFVSSNSSTPRNVRKTEEITITIPEDQWCWPIQQAASAWNGEHPEQLIRLRFQVAAPVQLRSRLTLAVAQGAAADLSLLDSVWVAEFADRGYLEPMANINPATAHQLSTDLVPPMIPHHTINGELIAYPAEADFAVLWYRKDWFEAEGIKAPTTWDQWLECLRHFQDPDIRDRYHIGSHSLAFTGGLPAGETTTFQLLPVLWSAGADVITDYEVVLNSPEAKSAVRFVTDLVRRHRFASRDVVNVSWNAPALSLAAGSVAMSLGGSYEAELIRAAAGWEIDEFLQRVGFLPVPAGPDGEPATLLGGLSYGIYRQSRRQELALGLLARALRPDILSIWCARTSTNPPTISGAKAIDMNAEPFLHETSQLFQHARTRWPIAEYQRVSATITRMFESAILGEIEPEDAVARAAVVISGITGLPERGAPRRAWASTLVASRHGF
jgi:multiple sugar transport system substrate-binding protein